MSILGSVLGFGTSLLSSASSNKAIDKQIAAQQEENQKNRDYNLNLAKQQNEWSIEQWNRENEYNTPTAQRQRLEEAGLNADLMYSSGLDNTAASSPAITSGAPSSPTDMSSYAARKQTIGQMISTSLDNALKSAQLENITANTDKTKTETEGIDIGNKTLNERNQVEIALGNSQLLLNDSVVNLNDQQKKSLEENILLMRKQCTALDSQIEQARAAIQNMTAETLVKQLEAAFRSKSMNMELQKLANELDVQESSIKAMLGNLTIQALLAGNEVANGASMRALQGTQMRVNEADVSKIQSITRLFDVQGDKISFDLSMDKKFTQIERTIGVCTDVLDGVSSVVGNIVGVGKFLK